jgi:hypothetical protein
MNKKLKNIVAMSESGDPFVIEDGKMKKAKKIKVKASQVPSGKLSEDECEQSLEFSRYFEDKFGEASILRVGIKVIMEILVRNGIASEREIDKRMKDAMLDWEEDRQDICLKDLVP